MDQISDKNALEVNFYDKQDNNICDSRLLEPKPKVISKILIRNSIDDKGNIDDRQYEVIDVETNKKIRTIQSVDIHLDAQKQDDNATLVMVDGDIKIAYPQCLIQINANYGDDVWKQVRQLADEMRVLHNDNTKWEGGPKLNELWCILKRIFFD